MKIKSIILPFLIVAIAGCKDGVKQETNCKIEKPIYKKKPYLKMKLGTCYYIRWGEYGSIRRYQVINYNDNGYFSKWLDAGEYDSHAVEFMPLEITENPAFKILTQ